MTSGRNLLTAAMQRVRGPVLLPLLGGNALLLLCAMLGLLIPDSHTWQVLLSLALALGVVSALLLWNALAVRRLRTSAPTIPLWHGALLLGAFLLIAASLWYGVDLAYASVETRAGYWNSQMSSALRHAFTYARLIQLQQFTLSTIQGVLVPAVLLPIAMESSTFGLRSGAMRRGLRGLAQWQHWAVAVVTLGVIAPLVPRVLAWHPAHSVTGETISALLRLVLAALLIVVSAIALLCVDAELLHRIHASAQPTREGTGSAL
ncbi:hypothetical protein [Terriglobus aquaticus]|uniref:Uncharacterized protein n=1 Tax=Terriglobus aquaticus TaxID=940139 RepID=A0ABW9KL94_9BACT|nr:hypothetical protein [Terriglobus aquaticus]